MIAPVLDRPWLRVDLGRPHRVLSFAPHNPGFVVARHVLWREVRDADLVPGFDALGWLSAQCGPEDVAMLTSRDLGRFRLETAVSGQVRADCLATVGLSNAERVGTRQAAPGIGTVNILVALDTGLTDAALIEAMTIVAEARTAAIIDHGRDLPTGRATGTGTDCIAVACPPGGDLPHAGLHTETGEAIGRATYDAVAAGARDWMAEFPG
ncbi:adenosylcobinamide amidohydrolase [Rhodobacterales bacterium HKCCE3408]|nr:adenosylcobinamide amidohydrolase [Rhodobacterales bacterium HKCCE3408]